MSLGRLLLASAAIQARKAVNGLIRRAVAKLLPADEEEPFPLTHKAVAHQQAQIRSATRRDAIPPPPREDD